VASRLGSCKFQVQVPIARLLGHIVKLREYIDWVLSSKDLMENVYQMLQTSSKKVVRLEACWLLSNITSSQQSHISQVIGNRKLVDRLLSMFETDVNDVKKEICYVFGNCAVEGDPGTVVQFLLQENIMKYYLNTFVISDCKLIIDALENMHMLLGLAQKVRVAKGANPLIASIVSLDGLKKMEDLQMHEDSEVYEAVVKIIQDFFEVDRSISL
jgi:hypothetical protein